MKTDWANLKKYVSENQKLAESNNEQRIVLIGDSITEFWKARNPDFFSGNAYINRGISGQTTPQMLLRFRQDVIDLNPSVVVILAGINDIAENTGPTTVEAIFGNIVSMAELAKANKIKVVLSSVLPALEFPWRADIQPINKIIALNALIRPYAAKNNLSYVDYYTAMADSGKGLDKNFSDDGVHPTRAGYFVMQPLLQKAISETLKPQ